MFRLSAVKAFFAALLLSHSGFTAGITSVQAAERLNVVTTTGMIADAASNVGGEDVAVKVLMGAGVDPHAYRQTRSDIVSIAQADLVLWNGLYLEAQMEDLLLEVGQQRPVEAVAENVPQHLLISSDDYQGRYDPHLWMNPEVWVHVVLNVRDALIRVKPDAETEFRARAQSYLAQIKKLAKYANTALTDIPPERRVLLTSHDAFSYFGDAYGFEVLGIQGISTESEAGIQRISALVDLLIERDINAVFVESSVSDRSIRALAEGAQAEGHEVMIGGELFSDAMGVPGTYEGTYIGMMDSNITTIARALGGTAPAAGMQNKLN